MSALLVAAGSAQADRIPSTWTWTNYAPTFRDVACRSAARCVAVGQQGVVLHTTGDVTAPMAWSGVGLKYPEELAGVTCSDTSCLAVSNTSLKSALYVSRIYRSVDDGATWSAGVQLPPAKIATGTTRSALALDCDGVAPGSSSCYAVGPAGGVWRSTDDGLSWSALEGSTLPAAYRSVDCAAPGRCVAVSGAATPGIAVLSGTTVSPMAAPTGKWAGASAVGCDTATRCTITDTLGQFASLALPERTWGKVKLFPAGTGAISELSCPAKDTCLGLTTGLVMRTTTLSSSDGGWRRRPTGDAIPPALAALACAESTCVSVGKVASWFASLDTGFSWSLVNQVPSADVVQCPAAFSGMCVSGGDKSIGVSRNGGTLWSMPMRGVIGLDMKSIGCTDRSTCLLLGKTQSFFTTDLENFPGRYPTTFAAMGTEALSCPTDDVCVGVSDSVTYTSLDAAKSIWSQSAFVPDRASAVTCLPGQTDPVTCLAVTRDFLVRGTMTVTDGRVHWRWIYTDADPPKPFVAVGCSPAPAHCTAVGPEGEVWTSTDDSLLNWTGHTLLAEEPVATRPALSSASCLAPGVCMAGGAHGGKAIIASTTNDWADYSVDEIGGIEGGSPTIKSFGCETIDRCVAVGDTALVGVRGR